MWLRSSPVRRWTGWCGSPPTSKQWRSVRKLSPQLKKFWIMYFVTDIVRIRALPVLKWAYDRKYLFGSAKRKAHIGNSEGCCLVESTTMLLVEFWRRVVHGALILKVIGKSFYFFGVGDKESTALLEEGLPLFVSKRPDMRFWDGFLETETHPRGNCWSGNFEDRKIFDPVLETNELSLSH